MYILHIHVYITSDIHIKNINMIKHTEFFDKFMHFIRVRSHWAIAKVKLIFDTCRQYCQRHRKLLGSLLPRFRIAQCELAPRLRSFRLVRGMKQNYPTSGAGVSTGIKERMTWPSASSELELRILRKLFTSSQSKSFLWRLFAVPQKEGRLWKHKHPIRLRYRSRSLQTNLNWVFFNSMLKRCISLNKDESWRFLPKTNLRNTHDFKIQCFTKYKKKLSILHSKVHVPFFITWLKRSINNSTTYSNIYTIQTTTASSVTVKSYL